MRRSFSVQRILIIGLCFLVIGCTEDEDLFTNCGVVIDRELHNPIADSDGQDVTIASIPAQNLVVVRDGDGATTLVLLQGVSEDIDPDELQPALDFLASLGTEARFIRADDDCEVDFAGSTLVPGAIINSDGKSFAEELLLAGYGRSSRIDDCGADLVENCYAALELEGNQNND